MNTDMVLIVQLETEDAVGCDVLFVADQDGDSVDDIALLYANKVPLCTWAALCVLC